ncbi:SCO family protein [Haliangium ochraceum]|uniref:Electron transport protein SCO1/SenC n=1 Tax=Haliangium ochraceum (strain DSM 14365 / JCM 11303 / SMP-2) TaxID=502025 RepID=D0LM89_HALO1|nr:SCO family protein [Haliangium ochraceum]ACY16795.1 electron transport protein SCO1/SenC [Haliangium ochraceum DSM 14365]
MKRRHYAALRTGLVLLTSLATLAGCEDAETPESPEAAAEAAAEAAEDGTATAKAAAATPNSKRWGANYFPNIELTTHEGEKMRFFDDMVKDKVVVINFIFTSCAKACPLETARLRTVYEVLGDRVGKDVFMYSISIDPETDTPEVLADYRERFRIGDGWYFLTGDRDEIITLRKKLGLYIEEIQDDPTDHNLSLIIGNQSTGQWMKRSPMENPHFLAMQIGGWLHNWKMPSLNTESYDKAPKLRKQGKGEELFRTRCSPCHTIGGGTIRNVAKSLVGPDLMNVGERREDAWLRRWLAEPDKMLAEEDPIAMAMYAQFNRVAMPNLELNEFEIDALLSFIQAESERMARAANQGMGQ